MGQKDTQTSTEENAPSLLAHVIMTELKKKEHKIELNPINKNFTEMAQRNAPAAALSSQRKPPSCPFSETGLQTI